MDQSNIIIDALMRLLEGRAYDKISIQDIADEAGVDLATLHACFASRGDILDAFVRRIDHQVLSGRYEDMAEEPPRERLFDVLMARIDALRPYRGALRSLLSATRRDPALGVALNSWAVRSSVWMLAAAGVDASGLRGTVAAQALTISYLKVIRTFVREDDPGLPRTMAQLDQELRKAEERHNRLARWVGPALRSHSPGEAAATPASTSAADAADRASFAGDPPDGGVDAVTDGALESDTVDAPSDPIPHAEAADAAEAVKTPSPVPGASSDEDAQVRGGDGR